MYNPLTNIGPIQTVCAIHNVANAVSCQFPRALLRYGYCLAYASGKVTNTVFPRPNVDVVVYRITIVAIEHGLLKKFWPFGNRLRSTV